MSEPTSAFAGGGGTSSRASRAFTLPSHSPASSQRRTDTGTSAGDKHPQADDKQRQQRGHERAHSSAHPSVHSHHIRGHRHHRSQQIGARDMPPAAAQLSELLSPVKAAASSALSGTASKSGILAEREKERKPWRTDWSWADVQREKARNQRAEEHLRSSYTSLVASTAQSASALHARHAALAAGLASTRTLVSQLRDLLRAAVRHLDGLTTSSLPDLASGSRTHLAALRRAHVAEGKTQLTTLEARVATARERTAALRERVAACADKAAAHEGRERAEMRRHKRRVGLLWGGLAAVLVLWVAAAVWRGRRGGIRGGRDEWRARGSEELRSVLRSKGVEWALDGDGLPEEVQERGRYRRNSGSAASVGAGGLGEGIESRIEKMFESL